MTKRLLLAVSVLIGLTFMALVALSYFVRCSSTLIGLNATADAVNFTVGPSGFGELAASVNQVQILGASSNEINELAITDDRPIIVSRTAVAPLRANFKFDGSQKGNWSVTLRHMPDRKNWFEITTRPISIALTVVSDQFAVRTPADPALKQANYMTSKTHAVRFELNEAAVLWSRPFDVSRVSFYDMDDQDAAATPFSTLRAGSIAFRSLHDKKDRTLNGGEPLKLGELDHGKVELLRLADDGIKIVATGEVHSVSVGESEDLMPTLFEWFADERIVEVATLIVALMTLFVGMMAIRGPTK